MGRTLLAVVLVMLGARTARASDLALEWTAPRGCPTQDALRDGLATRLGRKVNLGADAPVELRGTVVALGGGYALDVRTRAAAGSERRELRARSCNELARASILMASLLLMDGANAGAPASPHNAGRTRAPAESATRIAVYGRTSVRGDMGSMPSAALGPGLAVGLAIASTRIELGGMYLPSQALRFESRSDAVGAVQLMAADAGVCQMLLHVPELGPCLRAEIGQLRARGENLAGVATRSSLWLLGSLGARLSVQLWRGLSWDTEVAAGLPFQRVRIAVQNLADTERTSAVVGRFETGLLLSF